MIAGEEMQRRVAAIALAATHDAGFALAGSGAIREHGFTRRPTADVDLFTDRRDPDAFDRALGDVVAQLVSEGFTVDATRRFELFARLRVALGDEAVEVDLGTDWRARQPVVLALGPVLHEYDAVSNKVAALFSRAEARDYLDVDAIRRSGRFSDTELRMTTWADEIEAAGRTGDQTADSGACSPPRVSARPPGPAPDRPASAR